MVLINIRVQVCGKVYASPFATCPFVEGSTDLCISSCQRHIGKKTMAITAVAAKASTDDVTSLAFSAFCG